MICKNCGSNIQDDAKFCPHCGTVTGGEPQRDVQVPAYTGPEGPVPGGGKKKGLLIGGIVAAVVAVAALAAIFAGGLFSSPRGQLEQAMGKSLAAYQAAEKALGMPDVSQWQQDQSISQGMRLELTGLNSDLVGYDLSALEGLGLELSSSYSGRDRQMFARLAAFWGEEDLLALQMVADGPELYVDIPQITGEFSYGVNTETLGADLMNMTGDDSMKDLSFNLFDLTDLALEKLDQEKLKQEITAANRALWEQAEVKKTGSKTLNLNGTDAKATAYQVTVPQAALDQYVDSLETALSSLNYYELYQEMFQSMGMPQEAVQDLLDELESMDVYGELADGLREAVAQLGDLELEVCLSGGYVSAVRWEGEIQGENAQVLLTLGGGEEYVDNWSLELSSGETGRIEIVSTGDHGLKSGVFTDETTLRVREGSGALLDMTSNLTLNPRTDRDNFQWTLEADSSGLTVFSLDATGDCAAGEGYLHLLAEDVTLKSVGMELCSLSFEYHVSDTPDQLAIHRPLMVPQMSEEELMQMVQDTQERALQWASRMESLFLTRLPEELLWALM